MENILSLLEWDSIFFGLKIGKANLNSKQEYDEIKEKARLENYDLIYLSESLESENSDTDLSRLLGKQWYDTKIIFHKTLSPINISSSHEIRQLNMYNDDVSQLYELAYASGEFSRFKLDSKFLSGKFEELYKLWIDNSINRKIADLILISQTDNNINGFVTLRNDNKYKSTIGLIAVLENQRGKKIGKKLMETAEMFAHMNDTKTIEVATQQKNENALQFYKKMGYIIKSVTNIYHLWIYDENTI